jgi:hypothetical protein
MPCCGGEFTREAVEALLAVAGLYAGSVQAVVELRVLGGALARPAEHRSVFCHRDGAFTRSTIGVAGTPAEKRRRTGGSARGRDDERAGVLVHRWPAAELRRSCRPERLARSYD